VTPIIRRELLAALRTRTALLLQLGVGLACALLVLIRWPTGDAIDLSGAGALQVLRIVGYGLLTAVIVLIPAYPATSLVREKNRGTLALLFNTPLGPLSIYAGKLIAALGFSAVLLVMTFPAAAACYALGGVGAEGGILVLYGVLALATVQLASLSLFVSSRAQSTDGALRVSYALVLTVCVVTLGPQALLRGTTGVLADAAAWLQALSPIPPVMEVLGQGDVGSHGMLSDRGAVRDYLLVAPLMSLACAAATVLGLNHAMFDRARPAGVMTEDRHRLARIGRRVLFLVDPQRRSGGISLWVNPVMVKEFRSRRFGRSHWTLRLIAVCAVLSLGLTYLAAAGALGWGIEVIGGVLVLLQVALLMVFAPSLAAPLISAERESGSWQLLRMTPLSPGVILRGKLMSVAWPLLLLMCATLPGYVVIMITKPALQAQVGRVVVCLLLTAAFAVLVSAAVGSLFRATATATVASYTALLTVCVGPLLIWLGREAPFGHRAVHAVLTLDPVAAALRASEMPRFTQYDLLPANWWVMGAGCVMLLVFLGVRTWRLFSPLAD
jgi:ABC-type transport system involved in multi-copper enzyme maturation permease subunit